MSEHSTKYLGCHSCFSTIIQLESALALILIAIKVCIGSIPQAFFVLHLAAAQNRSLKGAKLAITLYRHLFVYIRMHTQSRNDALQSHFR